MLLPVLFVHVVASLLYCNPLLAAGQAAAAAAYSPLLVPCPAGFSLVREAGTNAQSQTLSQGELAYISAKQDGVLPDAWSTYLSSVERSTSGSSLPPYVSEILGGNYGWTAYPRLGIATSGGGYRAATFGAGVLNALDGRNASAVAAGTGGLLQAATYLAGLSGGSWLVTSLAQANFPTIPDLVFGTAAASAAGFGGWNAEFDLFEPSNSTAVNAAYVLDLIEEVEGKHAEGFPVTLSDVWARALSRHFANGTDAANFYDTSVTHGAGIIFSSLANLDTFQTYVQPFPILVSDSYSPNENTSAYADLAYAYVPLTNPIYEFNIYEFGSYDPTLGAFVPMEYLGSTNTSTCVTKFDQVSFVEALSASLFNEYNTSAAALQNSSVYEIIEILEELIPESDIDYTVGIVPNPFQGLHPETFIDTNETYLQLVDGGEDDETVPLQPLLVKAREVDVIFAIDAASDTEYHWVDGSSVIATQERMAYFVGTYSFPPVPPDNATWLAEGLTRRPTFFGCNSSAASGAPLLIYLGNGGPPLGQTTGYTNTSTAQLAYSADELEVMLSQTFDVATQGIAIETADGWEKDPEYASCLACAVVDRARERQNIERSGLCASCLERYCWS
ncbi:lysophospholipase [Fomitopsis serialis]|uniref:lysophospholipase n=1 Tax=Fomitopsis serialis TaxID=139415 RepID=UPI00200858C0|nr:lysophospholipase [Neoantrodia serialis]KAH9928107.1 lysophospholipase [Neoantrodia serialis]